MAGIILRFLLYYAASGIVSYAAPRLLIAAGVPLDQWIIRVARLLRIGATRESAKWGFTLALGMALFGFATYYTTRSVPLQKTITNVTESVYFARLNDDILDIEKVPALIVLPKTFPRGKEIVVKDVTGNAHSYPIHIKVDGDLPIDGLPNISIDTDRGWASFVWDGKEWSLIN
jgi:hypothetical protein